MMDLALKHHDLEIADGDFVLCPTDKEAIKQAITMRLKTLAGEWFLDATLGIAYLTQIFGQRQNDRLLRQLIAPSIEIMPDVKQLIDFNVAHESDRKTTIRFVAILSDRTNIAINESIGF